ncbi:5635_t:CDS:1 [Cetraspora pellucida]|uniref:5635_t:CDS:1 n=1 Tax=Cetraspora pellucida TaxID=1433469 RepID=A0A9N9FUN5_9GLOM|nr:5635_t:CDS:1 [Cetraspora pellucida]
MVATPKITNKKVTSNIEQIKLSFGNDSNKASMISGTFPGMGQYMDVITQEPSPLKSGGMNDATLFDVDEWLATDIEQIISEGEDGLLFPSEASTTSYDVSPDLPSSITTPSLPFDNNVMSREFDSPLFGQPTPFSTSPILEPAIGFFPDLSNGNTTKLFSIVPSVTIPADNHHSLSIPIRQPGLTSALNIPWVSDVTNASNIVSDGTSSFVNSHINTQKSPLSSTKSSPVVIVPSKSSPTKSTNGRSRKRSESEIDKDPEIISEELAIKRAKNTDAARRSRLRKVMKMESLEKQVNELKTENSDLQTRIAVLESEKKGLEEKNIDKDNRIRLLEQQLAEAHERLIKR